MPNYRRLRRERHIQEAEGYLELGMPEHALRVMYRLCGAERGRDLSHDDGSDCGSPQNHAGILDADGRTNYLAGEAFRELERYEEAISCLERAVALIPDDIQIYLAMAWCYKRTGLLPLAIDALERAIEVDGSEAILHYNLACYWCLAENRDASLRCLAQAFEIDADFRDLVHDESDFDNLRDDPDFQFLTGVIA